MSGETPPAAPDADSEDSAPTEVDLPAPFPRVDALFAGEPPPAPLAAGPRIRRLKIVLGLALPMNVLGVTCWTGVPGAALSLYGWLLADGEVARVEAGEYATEDAAALMRLRTLSAWTLAFCVVSLMLQIYLFNTAYYRMAYDRLLDLVARVLGG